MFPMKGIHMATKKKRATKKAAVDNLFDQLEAFGLMAHMFLEGQGASALTIDQLSKHLDAVGGLIEKA